MTTKHTPGPWKFIGCGQVVTESRSDKKLKLLADVYGPHGDEDETEADAHLIAAAPDLLAACEAALQAMDAIDVGIGWVSDALRSAIAKAKGETK